MSVYVVDSNFFIQAHRITYPLDVVVSFWEKLKELSHDGRIISIDKVKNEIFNHNDDLEKWCRANLSNSFFKNSISAMDTYRRVIVWANSKRDYFLPKAMNEFLDVDEADAFIVAYALSDRENRIVVTHEISEPKRRNKIKIPDVCNALDVQYLNDMDMFRALKETF